MAADFLSPDRINGKLPQQLTDCENLIENRYFSRHNISYCIMAIKHPASYELNSSNDITGGGRVIIDILN
jgi:hypothetical protein